MTDIYFQRAREVLERVGSAQRSASAEIHAYSLPSGYEWGILAGLKEAAALLEGKPVDIYSMEEGEIFRAREPVMRITGPYIDYGVYESALLGILRHESSVATKAARIRLASWGKTLIFFGIRCVHPSVAPAVDRAAFIGGCDAVSGVIGARMINERPVGTMPHALILVVGDQASAWRAFDEVLPGDVPRIALCDTFYDERTEALLAANTLGQRLDGVRLDTPRSRRGDMKRIVEETRWALDMNGWGRVRIYVSGGLDEDEVRELSGVADGFGVGTSIAFPPSIDLSMDIVSVEGRPVSKRGKLPGAKQVYRCEALHDTITLESRKMDRCPACGRGVVPLLRPVIKNGELVSELPSEREIRRRVLERLERVRTLGGLSGEPILSA